MSTTWIDLTDLSHWHGHMTGIQRVVYNVAKHYAADEAARFFMFDPKVGFSEVSFETIALAMDTGEKDQNHVPANRNRLSPRRIVRGVAVLNVKFAKRSAKFLYKNSPARAQQLVKNKYIQLTANRQPELIADIQHPFATDDVILLPGASWHKATIIKNLGALKSRLGLKIAHVVYDMIPEIYPQYFGQGFGDVYIKHMFDVFSISDHLLAISENTKKDCKAFQDKMLLPKVPITVFRLGDNPTHVAGSESPDERVESGKFILAVGTLEIRKNYLHLYYMWKKAQQENKQLPKLVIVGQPGWLSSDSMYLMQFDPQIRDQIITLNNLNDAGLTWLYKNCLFTIYPSWYEGWGLPIAESLNYGKFCISSNVSSMPEIAGDLIEYFDPYNPNESLALVTKYVENPDLLARAEQKIKQEYHKVQWDKTYQGCREVTKQLSKS